MLPDGTHNGGLYIIWLSDTHYYGGRTVDFAQRWYTHISSLRRGVHKNPFAQAVFNKHGVFKPLVVLEIEGEAARTLAEQDWLDANFGSPGCVNLSSQADSGWPLGRTHTEETKRKMSEARTPAMRAATAQRNRERYWTPEMRVRLAKVHRGIKHTDETRRKMSESKRRPDLIEISRETLARNRLLIPRENSVARARRMTEGNKGKVQSPEHVAKRAESHRGRKNTPETIARMSESAKRRSEEHPTSHGAETRALISEQQRGRVWINDGERNARVFPAELPARLDAGWVRGKLPHRPRGR